MSRYREIDVSGSPYSLGTQIGEAARQEVRGFCEIAMERINKTVRISREAALRTARESIPYAEQYSADMVDELRGIAAGAGVSLEEVMLLQVRNQLQPDKEGGCTSLSWGSAVRGDGLVAQNWDADPALDPFTVVLKRRPTGKPALMTITQAGLIAYIGCNDAGIGLCLNTLPAPSRRQGVPHYFTVRGIYEADSLEGAAQAVRRAERAIPANIMMTTPQGPADLEVTIDDVHVLQPEVECGLAHTNHCLHPDLVPINSQFPDLIQSHSRKQRIESLIDSNRNQPPSREQIEAALRDHEHYPRSICRHVNDEPVTGFWQTVFSVIIEPHAGVMHLTRGTPCDHPYETYRLN